LPQIERWDYVTKMRRRHVIAGSLGVAGAIATASPAAATPRVRTGLDRLVESRFATLAGQRVGVISNPTGVDQRYRHLVDLMHGSGRVDIAGVFGPEHGFRGSAQAGGSEGTGIDARTGLTVYDAYGATQAKWEQLYATAGVDTVVFDIQDVGARFYTYIWTLYDAWSPPPAPGSASWCSTGQTPSGVGRMGR